MSPETTVKKTRAPRSSTPLAEAARRVDKAARKVTAAEAAVVKAKSAHRAATEELVRISQGSGVAGNTYQDQRGGGTQAP